MPPDCLYAASSGISTAAIIPGMTTMNGMNIFGNDPMIGVRCAADMLLDAIARCTSTKFVVQYPKLSTNPNPNTRPSTLSTLFPNPVNSLPGHADSCPAPPGPADTFATRPCTPPTFTNPTIVNGNNAATITKNCNTSL